MEVIAFKLEKELLEKLNLCAVNMNLSRSEVIRLALEKYLSECK
jgi:metal-responsive CopG/Arc/MetJ family transcriptional regulator